MRNDFFRATALLIGVCLPCVGVSSPNSVEGNWVPLRAAEEASSLVCEDPTGLYPFSTPFAPTADASTGVPLLTLGNGGKLDCQEDVDCQPGEYCDTSSDTCEPECEESLEWVCYWRCTSRCGWLCSWQWVCK